MNEIKCPHCEKELDNKFRLGFHLILSHGYRTEDIKQIIGMSLEDLKGDWNSGELRELREASKERIQKSKELQLRIKQLKTERHKMILEMRTLRQQRQEARADRKRILETMKILQS